MSLKKRPHFADSTEAELLRTALDAIEESPQFSTETTYTSNGEKYPNHRLPFRDKHMSYIETHPEVDIQHYLSNLRLTSKKR